MKRRKIELAVNSEGTIRLIYSDDARFLLNIGEAKIERASHVEPRGKYWIVDLTPIGGPIMPTLFKFRQTALDYEAEWLKGNWL